MKILLVEDELGIIQFLQQGLEEEGFKVESISDGVLALEAIKKNQYDIILLDWMLPNMDGLSICRATRAALIKTPIIFLTAKDTPQETIDGLKSGANDFIKKPFNFDELLLRIKIHLKINHEGQFIYLNDVKIDTNRYQVFVNDNEVNLTQREYELVLYLVRNKNKICTRQQILEEVWNINYEYDTGVIDVFINAIRKKISPFSKSSFIKTIRGLGYMAVS